METEVVYLRSLEYSDLDRIHKWHNDPALYETLLGSFRHESLAATETWLRERLAFSDQAISYAICVASDGVHIGNAYMQKIDWVARSAELGMFIGEADHRSRGLGTAALTLLVKCAFRDMGLHRLSAATVADNLGAIKHLEKSGFILEGRLRKACLKGGGFKDVALYGLCSEDSLPFPL